ncbi:uncharacterized protein LOC135842484 [Planococcus citri]|uniref:uncharacterized protein LOC135842484 n=1 Tax=Planococcus citri TaxID=170843 RepID=UPI0031F832AC
MSSSEEFEKSLKNICKELTKSEDKYNLVLTEENYPKLQNLLTLNGMTFTVRDSDYSKDPRRILWHSVLIPYFNTPFLIVKTSSLHCTNGPRYYANRPSKSKRRSTVPVLQQNNSMDNSEPQQVKNVRTRKRQPSMKVGCNASMRVIVIKTFPEYSIKGNKDAKYEKSLVMKRLKETLDSNPATVLTEILYRISFSTATVHCHSVWTSFTMQRIDPALKNEIRNLVESGITNIETIKILLNKWVKENIGDVNNSARAYWPSKKTIQNHVMKYTSHASICEEKVDSKIRIVQQKNRPSEKTKKDRQSSSIPVESSALNVQKKDFQSYSITIESTPLNVQKKDFQSYNIPIESTPLNVPIPINEVYVQSPEVIEIECVACDDDFEMEYSPTETFDLTESSPSSSKIRELAKIIYDRSLLLPDDYSDPELRDKLRDVFQLMNDHIDHVDRNQSDVSFQS